MQFSNVSISLGDQPILVDVNFDFPMNELVWISSKKNGAGKSTVLQILAGLQFPDLGNFYVNGLDVSSLSFDEFLPYRMRIGYGFDIGGLIHNRSLLENLKLPLNYHRINARHEAEEIAMALLSHFQIEKFKNLRPSDVPVSIRKLTVLLRSLILQPQVLLWDDPTVGLSDETAQRLFAFVKQKKSLSILIASHDEKIMNQLKAQKIILDEYKLFDAFQPRKVVGL